MPLQKKPKAVPEIPTAALPDIIFMLLFFFMVSTVMRENTLKVNVLLPQANQVQKMEKANLVANIYIGKPKEAGQFGTAPRIQVNDVFINLDQIKQFAVESMANVPEVDKNRFRVAIKGDVDLDMGVVIDIREELRETEALKIYYAASKSGDE